MYFTLFTAVALFVAPALADFAVNDPKFNQCETAKISWQKTKAPYNVIIVDAAEPCGEPLAEVGDFDKTFVEWAVKLPAGKVVQVSVADADDDEAWSGNITIGAGKSDCLTAASVTTTTSTTDQSTTSSSNTGSTTTDNTGSSTTDDSTDSNDEVIPAPVGAANAGSNSVLGQNAAPSAHALSAPAMALSLIAAVAALAL